MNNSEAKAAMRVGGSLSLVIFPLMLMLAFALHFESLFEFFEFELRYEPNTATEFMETLRNPAQSQRYFIMPHMVGYLSIPLLISMALSLGYILFRIRPWFALIGTMMTCVGAVFMSGVFASWLSFAAVGNVSADQAAGAIPVLEALTEMQGVLLYSSILSVLSLLGLMVLAVGLFLGHVAPKWSAVMIFIGNLMIIVFMDLDNWMFIGAFMILLGMAPIGWKLFKGQVEGV